MQTHYLTKSDFKVAQTCPTKLYYRKMGYPTTNDGDEYLSLLSDQGYLIEALARALYPDGRTIGYSEDVESAARETIAALADPCVLFEATFISKGKLARVDILIRHGDIFELIEIKSRSFDGQKNEAQIQAGKPNLFRSFKKTAEIRNEWRPYLEDVAFQTTVLQEVFPEGKIIPYLMMPDSSLPCGSDGLHHRFAIHPLETDGQPSAAFIDDIHEMRNSPLLACIDVSEEVSLLIPEVHHSAGKYLASLNPTLRRIHTMPSVSCRACEYRVSEGEMRGFNECWRELADASPHILDLYHVSEAGGRQNQIADKLIVEGKAGLFDIPVEFLVRRDGTIGEVAKRQRVQINYMRENREWVDEQLGEFLATFVYPLHFIDFETCTPAIPRYKGMRPYEVIAFQWSCQTIDGPDAPPQSSEWLQSADSFPNIAFAEALRRQTGDEGTILIWSSHEKTILSAIHRQLDERGAGESDLSFWIADVLASGRLVDLNRLTFRHYFHPRMGGSTSLKVVTDAVWRENIRIRERLPRYTLEDENGPLSPYRTLPPVSIAGREIAVAEGSGAILAYYQMMERMAANAAHEADQWRQLLLQYCELDTLAMVMVWWHWRELTGQV